MGRAVGDDAWNINIAKGAARKRINPSQAPQELSGGGSIAIAVE